jgi:hypothetical protein
MTERIRRCWTIYKTTSLPSGTLMRRSDRQTSLRSEPRGGSHTLSLPEESRHATYAALCRYRPRIVVMLGHPRF